MSARSTPQIVPFIAIAYGWAWMWWVLSIILLNHDAASPLAVATTFFGTCAPVVAAWVSWWRASGSREASRKLGRCVRPSGSWGAWSLPTLAILVVLSTASWVQHCWGDPVPAAPALWLILPQLLLMLVAGGGQEEIGWRGWLQPALRARTGRWAAPLIVGVIWFCWHLPLWWMPGSSQAYLPMPAFAMMTVGMSLLMARTLEATNGRPAVAIWLHAINNLAAGWLVFFTPDIGAAQPGSWAMGIAYILAGVIAMLIRPAAHERQQRPTIPDSGGSGPTEVPRMAGHRDGGSTIPG
jgi:membrane protease YdiL (CAAX protease family)